MYQVFNMIHFSAVLSYYTTRSCPTGPYLRYNSTGSVLCPHIRTQWRHMNSQNCPTANTMANMKTTIC